MRVSVLMCGVFLLTLTGVSADALAQKGSTNSISSESYFDPPNGGQIKMTYYGQWKYDTSKWDGYAIRTKEVTLVKGQWIPVPNTTVEHALQDQAIGESWKSGIYGLPKGGMIPPGVVIKTKDWPYQQGKEITLQAELLARPKGKAGDPPVVIALSTQTLTMP